MSLALENSDLDLQASITGQTTAPLVGSAAQGPPISMEVTGAHCHVDPSASAAILWSAHSVHSILSADQLCRMLAKTRGAECALSQQELKHLFPDGLVVRIRRSHRRGRGSIPRLGVKIFETVENWRNLVPCNPK